MIINKESSYLKYWNTNNLYGWAMSQKLHVNNFKQVKDTFVFDGIFTKNYNKDRDEGYFLGVDNQYPENLRSLHNDLPFSPKEIKTEKVENLVANLRDKTQ